MLWSGIISNLTQERRFGRESKNYPRWRIILYKVGRKSASSLKSSSLARYRRRLCTYRANLREPYFAERGKALSELSTENNRVPRSSATMYNPPLRRGHYFLLPGRIGHLPESGFTVGCSSFSDLSQIMR